MKESIPDLVERHVIYFLVGFVAVVSAVIVLTFLYILMVAPMMIFGYYYTIIVILLSLSMYYIGRKIMNEVD